VTERKNQSETDPSASMAESGFERRIGESTRVSVPKMTPKPDGRGPECLVVLYGASIGRKIDICSDEVFIGRDPSNHVVLDVDSVSRGHARIILDGDERLVEDMGSTNGTYLNDQPVERSLLRSGDLVRIGDVICKYLCGRNVEAAYHEEIYRMTISDGLTSVANVRALNEFLDREMARSRRYGRGLALIMMDIDHFKRVNDELGHLTGDYVLREMAQICSRRVRREELFARYGGEEFALVLPETPLEGAVRYGESLRALVETHPFSFEGNTIRITISLGVAILSADTMNSSIDLIRAADERLYDAKRSGRNRVAS
jgi:two-component system, cell cycle response regulator